jgi:alpha-1,2-mannosyltransferase
MGSPRWRVGYPSLLGVVLVVLFWLGYEALLVRQMYASLGMNDFGKFYYSARLFLADRDMYGPSPATVIPVGVSEMRQFWNMNPPHFHLLLLPLAFLRPAWALLAWGLMSVAALVVSLRRIARELGMRWTARGAFWTTAVVVICSATSITVATGQLTFLLMLPVTIAWAEARRGRWPRAAVWLGIGASVKPFLGIFLLWLLLRRRFREAGVMLLVIALCFGAGLAVFGVEAHARWIAALRSVDWTWVPMNGSIAGLLQRSFATSPRFTPLADLPIVAGPLVVALALAAGAWALSTFRRVDESSPESIDRVFAGLLLTALVVSPLGWIYYLWLAAGPLFAVALTFARHPWLARDILLLVAVPGLIWPVAMTGLWRLEPWGAFTLGSTYAWTTLALWSALVLDARRGHS